MGVLSNKIDKQLKPGDHIYSWRQAYIHAHHGHLFSPILVLYLLECNTFLGLYTCIIYIHSCSVVYLNFKSH